MTGNPVSERRCPDDLVVRGQRGHLNELEQHALAAHLAQCADCRAAAALVGLFNEIPGTRPDDDELIARVAGKAIRRSRRFSRWAGLRVAAVVALVILSGGAATAALVAYRRSSEKPPAPLSLAPSSPAHDTRRVRTRDLPQPSKGEAPAEIPAAEPALQPQPVAEAPRKHRPTALVAPAPVPAPAPPTSPVVPAPAPTLIEEPTAASLFSEANQVRRSGDVRKAIALYQSLRQHFPASSQAMLSAISVGDLLLGEGDGAGAIAAYTAYLRGAPQGTLTEEALYGRARALRMLGRGAEEQQTWEELVRRFPRSAYQPFASRRLRELAP